MLKYFPICFIINLLIDINHIIPACYVWIHRNRADSLFFLGSVFCGLKVKIGEEWLGCPILKYHKNIGISPFSPNYSYSNLSQ